MMNFEQPLSALFKQKSILFPKFFCAPTAAIGQFAWLIGAPELFKADGQQSKAVPLAIQQHEILER
jgi:hypothetical protein